MCCKNIIDESAVQLPGGFRGHKSRTRERKGPGMLFASSAAAPASSPVLGLSCAPNPGLRHSSPNPSSHALSPSRTLPPADAPPQPHAHPPLTLLESQYLVVPRPRTALEPSHTSTSRQLRRNRPSPSPRSRRSTTITTTMSDAYERERYVHHQLSASRSPRAFATAVHPHRHYIHPPQSPRPQLPQPVHPSRPPQLPHPCLYTPR